MYLCMYWVINVDLLGFYSQMLDAKAANLEMRKASDYESFSVETMSGKQVGACVKMRRC